MIFNVTPGGGGGGLNLKVVGGTAKPTNPRENTIWVNTTTAITGYVLSPTQPETGTEGLVWIKTADTGVEINVGRKNAVLLHLADGKLYTGGAWTNIDGWVYAGASWTQFAWNRLYLFKDGVDNTELTGGWTGSGWSRSGYSIGTVTNDGTKLVFGKKSGNGYPVGGTAKQVDLNGFKTITAIVTAENTSGNSEFCISKSKTVDQSKWVAGILKTDFNEENAAISFSLANPGACYIGFGRISSVKEVYIE